MWLHIQDRCSGVVGIREENIANMANAKTGSVAKNPKSNLSFP
jgi:hypothetical protein